MAAENSPQVLRLRKKHAPGSHAPPEVGDGERLIRAQSVSQALLAAIIVSIAFAFVWSMLSLALGRVFPWLTLLLGWLIGLAVRRSGQGLDWRFPVVASTITIVGAVLGNIVVGAAFTGDEIGVSTLTLLLGRTTTMTWPVFFDEVITVADMIFAIVAAVIAAYFANRRLNRQEYQALRIWQQRESGTKNE